MLSGRLRQMSSYRQRLALVDMDSYVKANRLLSNVLHSSFFNVLSSSPSWPASVLFSSSSGSFAITFSNCDHSASTEENSLPTYQPKSDSKTQTGYYGKTYSNDCLQISVKLIDIGKDVLEALQHKTVLATLLHIRLSDGKNAKVPGQTWSGKNLSSYHSNLANQCLPLQFKIALLSISASTSSVVAIAQRGYRSLV